MENNNTKNRTYLHDHEHGHGHMMTTIIPSSASNTTERDCHNVNIAGSGSNDPSCQAKAEVIHKEDTCNSTNIETVADAALKNVSNNDIVANASTLVNTDASTSKDQEENNESHKISHVEQSSTKEHLLCTSSSSSVTLDKATIAVQVDNSHEQLPEACMTMDVDTEVNVETNMMSPNRNANLQATIQKNTQVPDALVRDDTMEDIFPDRNLFATVKGRRKKKNKKRKSIHICQLTHARSKLSAVNQCVKFSLTSSARNNDISNQVFDVMEPFRCDGQYVYSKDTDALDFFSDMHEDQDPETMNLINEITKERLEVDFKQLSEQNEKSKAKIKHELKTNWTRQQLAFVSQVQDWKQKLAEKQKAQRLILAERFKVSMNTKENEAKEALEYVSNKTNQQIESINRNYQQYRSSWNQDLNQKWTADLNKVKARAMEVQRGIRLKLQSYKAERDADFNENQSKLRKHHLKRRDELTTAIAQNKAKLEEKHKQQLILLERLQNDRMRRLKDKMIHDRSNLLCLEHEDRNNSMKSKLTDKYNKSDEINEKKQKDLANPADAAIQRYKVRQNVFMKGYIPVSLHVQIHDEGLGIIWKSNKISSEMEETEFDFVPWGFKARQLLHSIVCGELDVNDALDIDTKCEELLQGGQVKCVISDARKCHDEGVSDSKIKDNSDKCQQLKSLMLDLRQQLDSLSKAEISCKGMLMKIELALRKYKDKMNQTKKNHQGAQLPNDQQITLAAAFAKYDNQISIAERKRQEMQSELLKIQANKAEKGKLYNHAQNEYQKEAQTTALDDDSKSGITNILDLLRKDMMKKKPTDPNFCEEELLLLALYPSNDRLPSAPIPTDSANETNQWAEPGSQLVLDVPEHRQRSRTILPTRYDDTVFRQLHSECSSNKGRQASTLLNRQHYKFITTGILKESLLASHVSFVDSDLSKSYDFAPSGDTNKGAT